MKTLYFTATGNSLYVAKSIGGQLISIPKMVKEKTYEFTDDKIGIIFPIYSVKVQPYIEEFLKKAKFNCDYLFAVMTYGIFDFASANHLFNIGKNLSHNFSYINTIKMVDNFLPGFNMEKQIKSEHKKEIEKHLKVITSDINNSKEYILKNSPLDKFITNHMISNAKKNPNKESLRGGVIGNGIKNFIKVEKTCIKCGVCSQVCPVNNIKVDKNLEDAVSLGNYCVSCFACTQNCPTNSIRMKGEMHKSRYRNSHITLKEIIDANN